MVGLLMKWKIEEVEAVEEPSARLQAPRPARSQLIYSSFVTMHPYCRITTAAYSTRAPAKDTRVGNKCQVDTHQRGQWPSHICYLEADAQSCLIQTSTIYGIAPQTFCRYGL